MFERMMEIPTLTTHRLVLVPVTEQDIPAYKKHFVDYNIIRHLARAVPWPYPADGVESFLKAEIFPHQGKDRWLWGIHLGPDPKELIGAIELWREGKPENRGFWLSKAYWNQGIMTEAVAPINDYAFDALGFEKLVFSNAKGNAPSRRIKEKTGAQYLRTEQAEFVDPAYTEHEIWELTKEAWLHRRRQAE
ncbi:MAG TPA: N-acetyltransferase [Gammaproteobacteria bacterium]|nr:N-acetyltransferase [Gammaproteobacteria bacterium]